MSMRGQGSWGKRAGAWLRAAWREALPLWRGAWGLLRRNPWQPLLAVGVLALLPALAISADAGGLWVPLLAGEAENASLLWWLMGLVPGAVGIADTARTADAGSGALLSLVRTLALTPLLYATLARLYHAPGPSLTAWTAARGKLAQWRQLLFVAFGCMAAQQVLSFALSFLTGVGHMLLSLFAWLSPVALVLSVLVVLLTLYGFIMPVRILFAVWLTEEAEGGTTLPVLLSAWRFVRAHARALLVGLFVPLTLGHAAVSLALSGVLLALFRAGFAGALDVLLWVAPLLEALGVLLASAGIAALYQQDSAGTPRDPFTAPEHLDTMKRANL